LRCGIVPTWYNLPLMERQPLFPISACTIIKPYWTLHLELCTDLIRRNKQRRNHAYIAEETADFQDSILSASYLCIQQVWNKLESSHLEKFSPEISLFLPCIILHSLKFRTITPLRFLSKWWTLNSKPRRKRVHLPLDRDRLRSKGPNTHSLLKGLQE
jgi:hypothetical protein